VPLTVLSIAFPFAPVGPSAVGGAEQIVATLDEALVAEEHRSIVVAAEGSQTAGKLYAFPRLRPELHQESRPWCRRQFQQVVDRALASESIDLIHMHGMDFYEYKLPETIPVMVTLHLPLSCHPHEAWNNTGKRYQFHCVSESQRRSCPKSLLNVEVIENGVALPTHGPPRPRKNYALVMGRICPEKNVHAALEAGTLAGTPVHIAGCVYSYADHQRYFQEKISPLLQPREGAPRHEFVGPLSPERRAQVFAETACLLHPTLAQETSSLVAMEAIAAGTPVIAYRSGALPEIVEDGVSGFLVRDVKEMAEAIKRVHTIDPQVCRQTAERRFSRQRMVREIFRLYRKLITRSVAEIVHA
jgi:glycosyltransferase involved in cell wall biosynthesis